MKDFEDTDREGAAMDSRKPLTAKRIEELRHSLSTPSADGNVWLDEVTSPEELLFLLSMLEKSYCVGGKNLHGHDCVEWEKRAWGAEARVQELLGEVERLKASTPPPDAAVREAVERVAALKPPWPSARRLAVESKRIMCQHCEGWFFPEEGVTLDDCPKCGRTVEVKPAPAPLPELSDRATLRARLDGFADPVDAAITIIVAHEATLEGLTRRLAEAEADVERLSTEKNHWLRESVKHESQRDANIKGREAAEARVRELEADNAQHEQERIEDAGKICWMEARVRELIAEAATCPCASDDEQTIAALERDLTGRFEHIVKVEAERDDLRAFKARVMEWARGDCCACSGMTEDKYGQRVLYTEKCYGCVEYSGDDDAVSLWAPAWEVGV